jgi:glycosyltransferase involved in cell wall biosynthesis
MADAPLRIGIVGMGGVTKQFRHWPERVIGRALARRGHYVANIAYHQPQHPALSELKDEIEGVTIRRVPVRHWPNTELMAALDELGPFDVLYLLHPRNVLAFGATEWARRKRIPTVYTWLGPLHDRYVVDDRERPLDETPKYERIIWDMRGVLLRTARNGRLRDHLRNYWLHQPLKAASALLPCSEFEAGAMRAMGLTQPQTVVPLWLDIEAIKATPSQPIKLPRPSILFIGQLTPRKGYDLLLRALPTVVRRYPTTTVQFVSGLNQEDRDTLERTARELGVYKHIALRGRVEDAELINLYRAADVYVTPTRYEGFGLTLLEAMAAGAPLVSTDIPVVNEIVQHSINGWLTRYNDPANLAQGILAVLDDPIVRQRLIHGGRFTLATRFQEQELVGRIETVLRETIAANPHGRAVKRAAR